MKIFQQLIHEFIPTNSNKISKYLCEFEDKCNKKYLSIAKTDVTSPHQKSFHLTIIRKSNAIWWQKRTFCTRMALWSHISVQYCRQVAFWEEQLKENKNFIPHNASLPRWARTDVKLWSIPKRNCILNSPPTYSKYTHEMVHFYEI